MQERLDQDGYVVMRVLEPEDVAEVCGIYDRLGCALTQGWHADLFSSDLAYRRAVHEEVGAIFSRRLGPRLDRYRLSATSFVVKEASAASRVPLHQDWTVVDYSRFRALHVVCPLVDVDQENGCLSVVRGSHRPPNRLSFAPSDKLHLDEAARLVQDEFLTPLPMRAGEAVLYDGRLLHASPPNRTSQRRLAFSCGFIPEEASLRIYYKDPSRADELEVLEVQDDFFYTHRLGQRPENARTLGWIEHVNGPITERHLRAWSAREPA